MQKDFRDWKTYEIIISEYLPKIYEGYGYLDLAFLTGRIHIEPISPDAARFVYRPNCTRCRQEHISLDKGKMQEKLKIYFTKYRLQKWTYVD